MQRKFRLTGFNNLKRVRRLGKSYAHPLVVLVALPNEQGALHIGVSAGRSVGNAVQRNRAKRLLREAARSRLPEIIKGWDLLLIARRPLAGATYAQALAASLSLLKRARLLCNSNDERS